MGFAWTVSDQEQSTMGERPYIGVILPPPAGLRLVKVRGTNPGGRVFASKTGELGAVGMSRVWRPEEIGREAGRWSGGRKS
jgi:hypothetical protein